MDAESNIGAVLTGDLIGFSMLAGDAADRVGPLIRRLTTDLAEVEVGGAPSVTVWLDLYRGDAWQAVVSPAAAAWRVALYARAVMRSELEETDTRVSIGIGRIDEVGEDRPSHGRGEAFTRSGRGLDGLSNRSMTFDAGPGGDTAAWDAAAAVTDSLIERTWTEKRSRAITGVLRGWTQQRTAGLWEPYIAQASVSGLLSDAGWNGIKHAMQSFERRWSRSDR